MLNNLLQMHVKLFQKEHLRRSNDDLIGNKTADKIRGIASQYVSGAGSKRQLTYS